MPHGSMLYAGVEQGEQESSDVDHEQPPVASPPAALTGGRSLRLSCIALLAATSVYLGATYRASMTSAKGESFCPEFADCSGFPRHAPGADHTIKHHRALHPSSPRDFIMLQQDIPSGPAGELVRAYDGVFKTGNRNSASHLWTSYLMNRSSTKTPAEFEDLFRSFCGISGSIVSVERNADHDMIMPDGLGVGGVTRWRLSLKDLDGVKHAGFMHYCTGCMAWPCLCDARENVKIDTKTISLAGGLQKKYNFVVIGNPCKTPDMVKQLSQTINDPAYGDHPMTLQMAAPELTCDGSLLQGAALSDHGHIMLAMFFDDDVSLDAHNEDSVAKVCDNRDQSAGMGPIFRTLAGVNPL